LLVWWLVGQPPDAPVVVTVTCFQNGRAPQTQVVPDPYDRRITQVSRWRLNINQPQNNRIAIVRKSGEDRPWPYTEERYESTTGLLEIPPGQFSAELPDGEYWYAVEFECRQQDGTVTPGLIDPRMNIRR
jgi:hypothetical protein